MYNDLVKYIRKQEKALDRIREAQKENKTARDENITKYPEKFERSERMHALVSETKRLDAEYSKLHEKELVYGTRIRLAVCSVVALVCNDIRDEIKEGGRLCGVSSHYKKFAAVVDEKVKAAGLDGLRARLDLSHYATVFLCWEYRTIRRYEYLCDEGLNAVAGLPGHPVNRTIYLPENINKVVAEYIREEKACYRLVSALEKKAQMISDRFAYCERTGIGYMDTLNYGKEYGERA